MPAYFHRVTIHSPHRCCDSSSTTKLGNTVSYQNWDSHSNTEITHTLFVHGLPVRFLVIFF